MNTDSFDLKQLCALAGVTPRTVYYYIQQGLIPRAGSFGPGARYERRHLARLQIVKMLQTHHLPLAEIRRQLGALSDEEVLEAIRETDPLASQAADRPSASLTEPPAYPSEFPADPVAAPPTDIPSDSPAARPAASRSGARAATLATSPSTPPAASSTAPLQASPSPASTAPLPSDTARDYIRRVLRRTEEPGQQARDMLPRLLAAASRVEPPVGWDRSQWERIALTVDIELHIRRPLTRERNRQVERILEEARRILGSEQS